jgi:PAS domain S-box-containing protein
MNFPENMMSFDVRTFAFILGLTHCMQVIVFIHQYKVNKTYRGIGWWLLWSATEAAGFVFILLRDISAIHLPAVIGQNVLLVLGTLFLYVGIVRFLDRSENPRILIPLFVLFAAAHAFFIFARDDMAVRGVLVSVVLATVSFMTAWALYTHKPRSITASANFNAVIFLIHGCVFTHRAGMILAGTPVVDFYTRTLFNTVPYLDALIVSLLWTFGLIVMLNQRLNAEMTEVKEHFEKIFNTGPDGAIISRLDDGVIRNINDGFTAITGFTRAESIGRSTLDIAWWKSPDDRGKFVEVLREKGFCDNFESVFLRRDKTEFFGLTSAKIITLQGGPHIVSVTRDISERRKGEERLKSLVHEKEILLKEIHHRVKNNFQIVASLLSLQSENVENAAATGALIEGRNRVQTLSLIHEKLYQSESLAGIPFADYIEGLVQGLFSSYGIDPSRIGLEVHAKDVQLGVDAAIPCGLIINELVSNCFKYAFPEHRKEKGFIEIVMRRDETGKVLLSVSDDGVGLPGDMDFKTIKSLGLQLVTLLAEQQLQGSIRLERDHGTKFTIEFQNR